MFERLTHRSKYGIAYTKIAANESNMVDVGECYTGRIIDRLAAYEDSGLSPEEVRELAKAKVDGRLAIMPCKVGDTVYLTTHGWVEETKVRTLFFGHPSYSRGSPDPRYCRIRCENLDMPWDSIGKTVFLSREAAEKAIAEVGK